MELYFPSKYDDVHEKEYYVNLKKKTLLLLDGLLNPEIDRSAELESLERYFVGLLKPKVLANVKENENILTDNAFQQMRALLEEHGQTVDVDITIHEFINKCLYLEKKYEQTKKNIPHRGTQPNRRR